MGRGTVLVESPSVERRCRALEAKTRLDLATVDDAIAAIRHPAQLRDRLGDAVLYAQRVEAEVAQLPTDLALPHDPDSYLGRFLRVWTPDESGHGDAQARLLAFLGLPVPVASTDDWLAAHLAWLLSTASTRTYDVVLMTYLTVGAMNEKLAMTAYQVMASVAAGIGEHELAEVLFDPMRRDESLHLGYYRTHARELGKVLRPWQRWLVRTLIVRTYAPVGARRAAHKPSLGRTLLALEDNPDDPAIASLTQAIAEDVIGRAGRPLPPFVREAMAACVAAARTTTDAEATPGPAPAAA